MGNIDLFKQDASVGDIVTIELTSGKSVNGKVIEISDFIILEKEDGKKMRLLDGIIGGWEVVSHQEITIAESKEETAIDEPITKEPDTFVNPKPDEPQEKQIGLKIVGKIDLSKFEGGKKKSPDNSTANNIHTEHKAVESPKGSPIKLTTGKKMTLKSFADLATLDGVKDAWEKDSKNIIRETGKIIRAGYNNFGFILDNKSGEELWFNFTELIDLNISEPTSLVGQPVVYTRSQNYHGGVAIAVHKPNSIEKLTTLAKEKYEQGQKGVAYEIVNHILYDYPDSHLANETLRSFTEHKEASSKKVAVKFVDNSFPLYKQARSFHDAKDFDRAVEFYKKAIESNQKPDSALKDLGMLLVSLAKKNSSSVESEKYLEEARTIMEDNKSLLQMNSVNMSYLENFYYSVRDFSSFKIVANKLLSTLDEKSDGPRYVFLCNKLASVYIKEGDTERARRLLNKALDIYPLSAGATNLLSIIDAPNTKIDERIEEEIEIYSSSDVDFESFHGGLSPFIEDTLNRYTDYDGIKVKDTGNFSTKTLSDIRALIKTFDEKKFAGRPSDRSRYLLTEGKLMQQLEPDDMFGLRSVMAKYCNDMAKIHIYNSSPIDVIRFYYSESFLLEEKYWATNQQVSYYLLTNLYSGKTLSEEINKGLTVDNVLKLVLRGDFEAKRWESILSVLLYNKQIFDQLTGKLYDNKEYYQQSLMAFDHFGISYNHVQKLEDYKGVWNQIRQQRLGDYRQIIAFLNSISNASDMEELSIRLSDNLLSCQRDWMCSTDVLRIQNIQNIIAPALDKFHKASGFRNKQLNCHEAENLINQLAEEITKEPTKLSYEGILPLLTKVLKSLQESYENIVTSSEPTPRISLLRAESVVDQMRVPLQIEVSIDKDSSPIYNVSLEIINSEEIQTVDSDSAATHLGYIEGGDPHIFKLTVKVSDYVIKTRAVAFDIKCMYYNAGEAKSITTALSLHLYNPEDFTSIPNKFAAVAESGPLSADSEMFYGQKKYIKGIVETIIESPSKQVIIYGQKRSGKSSVLNKVQQELTRAGAFCIQFSMGKIVRNISEVAFYYKILSEIVSSLEIFEEEGKEVPAFTIPSRNDFKNEDLENPLETFTKYMRQFKRACQRVEEWKDKRLVVLIDEFTYMYGAIKLKKISPTIMMQWKAITQDEKAQFSAVLVGQDVVPAFKNEPYARNAFGVIKDVRLSYLDEEDARDLIVKPILDGSSSRYSERAVELIMDYTACNPYYIQIFCSYLVNYMNEKHYNNVTEADVLDVASELITGVKALDPAKFENLLSSGETDNEDDSEGVSVDEAIKTFSDHQVETVIKAVAKASSNKIWAPRNNISTPLDKETEQKILDQLYVRDVLDCKDDKNYYRIKVRLYKEWLLKH